MPVVCVCARSDCDESRSKVRCGTSSTDDVTSQCVDVRVWCDGNADCDDASDETLCDTGRTPTCKVTRPKVIRYKGKGKRKRIDLYSASA